MRAELQAHSTPRRGRLLRQVAPTAAALLLLAIVLVAFLLLPAAGAAGLTTVVSTNVIDPSLMDFVAASGAERLVACQA